MEQRPEQPFVTVCLPVRNGADHIAAQLEGLQAQDYVGPWEVVVADNGSTDETAAVVSAWTDRLPLSLIQAGRRPSVNGGRNAAACHGRGQLLAFCDHDDIVRPNWITELVRVAAEADAVAGVIDCARLNDDVVRSWKDDRVQHRLVIAHGALPSMIGASCAVWRDAFEAVGGFDEAIQYGTDDVDMAWRLQFAGFTLGHAPNAIADYRYRTRIRDLARQSFDRSRMSCQLVERHRADLPARPAPSVSPRSTVASVLTGLPLALVSRRRRGRWVHTVARAAGWLWGRVEIRRGRTPWTTAETGQSERAGAVA